MPIVRIRVFGSETDTGSLITVLHGLDGVERVEQVADLMPHMDDEDSSSAGLPGDLGPGMRAIEVEVSDHVKAEQVREIAARTSELLDANVEFVEDF
ncbi:hypothetical protein [Marilutibacter chinensis]|uniref:Uncharacterized protein n=1 Tax=Marilutibacter chinensis TaxID=2912247 RepID=A0ABS9HPB9_9GAMM|nr:hypothetical protein [Lysobacter chinensis]MCF7220346.1 hypothetical protein [Lysobacter chinensis]